MANNFKVWVNSPTDQNTVTVEAFTSEDNSNQRKVGFKSGDAASSSYVNSGLREGTLVATALMQLVEDAGIDTSSVNFRSTVDAVKALLNQRFPKLYRHNVVFGITSGSSEYWVRFNVISSTATPLTEIDQTVTDLDAYNAVLGIQTLLAGCNASSNVPDIKLLLTGGNINIPAIGHDNNATKTICGISFVTSGSGYMYLELTDTNNVLITLSQSGMTINGVYDNVIAL